MKAAVLVLAVGALATGCVAPVSPVTWMKVGATGEVADTLKSKVVVNERNIAALVNAANQSQQTVQALQNQLQELKQAHNALGKATLALETEMRKGHSEAIKGIEELKRRPVCSCPEFPAPTEPPALEE